MADAQRPAHLGQLCSGYRVGCRDRVPRPFTAGLPAPPADPSLWGLLAWVCWEFFNSSPTITYNPTQNTQSLNLDGDPEVKGKIGAVDADGDALTYTVIWPPAQLAGRCWSTRTATSPTGR